MKGLFIFISITYFSFSFTSVNILKAEDRLGKPNFAAIECEIEGNISAEHISCHGADDGILSLNMTGGATPFSYSWSNGSNQETLTNLSPGTYFVTVTDANDCTLELSAILLEPNFFFANIQTNNESAPGANNGSATANSYGGNSPHTYQWNDANNSTSATISNLAVGDYTVTATDANGCISVQTATINAFSCSLTVVNTISQISCLGECDGLTGALSGGGMPPYTYEWNTGAHSSNISGLCEGIYTVTVTDSNGCSQQNEAIILEPALLEVEIENVINIGCFGTDDGLISVQGIGGKPPYHYDWSNGDSGSTIDSLAIGTYTVTLTGSGDCFATMNIDVTQAPALELTTENINAVNCSGGATGSASVMATGGTGAYNFDWSNGAEGNAIDSLAAGMYSVTVTDASNCTAALNFEIIQADALEISLTEMGNVSCFGATDGFANIQVTGGAAAYTYTWSNGTSGANINGLAPDSYTVSVTDADNCTAEMSIEITQPSALEVSVTEANHVTCFGESNGSINIQATGGTAAYEYLWSDGTNGNSNDSLIADIYFTTVTDVNNCTTTMGFEITAPPELELVLSETSNISCYDESNGFVSIEAAGGTAEYEYLWSNGATENAINGLDTGIYTATVTDANNCTTTLSQEITSPTELLIQLENIGNISCFGENNGFIEVSTSGGTAPFELTWSNEATTPSITELAPGTYTLNLTDNNSCTSEITQSITAPPLLELSIESITNIACSENSGAATVLASGGTGNYVYMWSNGMQSNTVSSLPEDNYSVSVFDENNCSASVDVEIISGEDNEIPTIITQAVELFLGMDGTATLSADQVDNGSFDNCEIAAMTLSKTEFDCSDLGVNTVTLMAIDLVGNEAQAEVNVTVSDNIAPQITCSGNIMQEGCAAVITYPFPILADNCTLLGDLVLEAGFVTGSVFPEGLTTVTYSYTDSGNNTATCSFDVTISSVLSIFSTVEHVSCNGDTNGSISVSDNANYTYLWGNGSTSSTLQNLSPATYNLTVTDSEECETVLSFEILEPAVLGLQIEQIFHEINGNSNGSIDITPTGGVAPYTFEWYQNGELFSTLGDITDLIAGDYSLVLADKNGCQFSSIPITIESVTGLDETELPAILNISPNPAKDVLFLNFTETINGDLTLALFNTRGQLVLMQNEYAKSTVEVKIDKLPAGLYYLNIRTEKGNWMEKIVVE